MAKQQNTYAKRKREVEKKQKAEEKRERRKKRVEQKGQPIQIYNPHTDEEMPEAPQP